MGRNAGLDAAHGDLCIQWDSDDWHHPDRIAAQVAVFRKTDKPTFLARPLCYDFTSDTAFVRQFQSGPIVGSILHPRNELRYPVQQKDEDLEFAKLWKAYAAMDNDPLLYVRFAHGTNNMGMAGVMQGYGGGWARGEWHICPRHAHLLCGYVLNNYDRDAIRRGPES